MAKCVMLEIPPPKQLFRGWNLKNALNCDLARKLVKQFSQQRSLLHIRTMIYYSYVSNVPNDCLMCMCVILHLAGSGQKPELSHMLKMLLASVASAIR